MPGNPYIWALVPVMITIAAVRNYELAAGVRCLTRGALLSNASHSLILRAES